LKSALAALPGLAVAALLAWAAMSLADFPPLKQNLHLNALLLVILLGMLVRSFLPLPAATQPGIRVAQRPVLRWAVAGLGFRLSLPELWKIGAPALGVVLASTFAALAFGWWIAGRLGLGRRLGLLLGVGGAICGASAVVAADSVVQAEEKDAAMALGIITLFGTLGIVLYPLVGRGLGMSQFLFGVWDGASLHEMAQVVAAGFAIGDEAARVATVVKLARICLLAPVVFFLAWDARRRTGAGASPAPGAATVATPAPRVAPVPWFLVLFVAFAAVNSLAWIPAKTLERIQTADLWLLCVGMAGVGLQTGFGDLRSAGLRPIAAGGLQWMVLSGLAYGLARWWCGAG